MQVDDLTAAELRLWEAFASSEEVDLRVGDPDEDDPMGSRGWGADRTVRAGVIAALLQGENREAAGSTAAVRLAGALVVGAIGLDYTEFRHHLRLTACRISERIWLYGAQTRQVSLVGSRLVGMDASLARIDGNLRLVGCQVDGEVKLTGTQITGYLRLDGTRLRNPGQVALNAPRLRVEHDVSLQDGFQADGCVTIRGARIAGELLLDDAVIRNPGGIALYASRSDVGSNIQAGRLVAEGEVRISGTRIAGMLRLHGARLSNPGGNAFSASHTEIGAHLQCSGGFRAEGCVRIPGLKTGGKLDLSGATLINPGQVALDARDVFVAASVECNDGFSAAGTVHFGRATLKTTLSFHQATLTDPRKWSLALWHLHAGTVDLRTAAIPEGIVNLRYATLDLLRDDPATWPTAMVLDGLRYRSIEPAAIARQRADWLRRESEGFLPQPYEQLASVYRQTGQETEARQILLAKQRERRRVLPWYARAWAHLQDAAVGYGYRPERAIGWLLGLLVLGTIAFTLWRPVAATVEPHPAFNPLIYTLDLLLPVINFGQSKSFVATPGLQWLAYLLTAAGWILATTIAAGVARAVNRS